MGHSFPTLGRANPEVIRALLPEGGLERGYREDSRPVIGYFHDGRKVIPVHAGDAMPEGGKQLPHPLPPPSQLAPGQPPYQPGNLRPRPRMAGVAFLGHLAGKQVLQGIRAIENAYKPHLDGLRSDVERISGALGEMYPKEGRGLIDVEAGLRWYHALRAQRVSLLEELNGAEEEMRGHMRHAISPAIGTRFAYGTSSEPKWNGGLDDEQRAAVERGMGHLSSLVDVKSGLDGRGATFMVAPGHYQRSEYLRERGEAWLTPHNIEFSAPYEFLHHLFYKNRDLASACVSFHLDRVKSEIEAGQPPVRLEGYGDEEVYSYSDHFLAKYMGRVVRNPRSGKWIGGSEILPCWYAYAMKDPGKLAREDPQYFMFGYNALRGRYAGNR